MTLSGAFDSAVSGLSVASQQIALVSRNIANQGNSSASRKTANVVSVNGLPMVASISRASSAALLGSLLAANGNQAQQSAISDALTQLQNTLGTGTNDKSSPAALIGALGNALQTYAASPQNTAAGEAAVAAAQDLANGLNNASATVQNVREQADTAIGNSVSTINDLLSQFAQANSAAVSATIAGTDATGALDQRDGILQQLSSQIGITTVTRANNDVAI